MKLWKIFSIGATLIILIFISLYLTKGVNNSSTVKLGNVKSALRFVGSDKCSECHKKEYEGWLNSHHDRAMDVASEKTVLGDFNNAEFEHFGIDSKFYRKNGKFFVHTQGPDGEMGDFEITQTFGVYPLQQYLVTFPGGRLQALPIAWDVNEKKWYHLYPDSPIDPEDWLYWTNAGQNWNGMCAECHTTNLRKNYNPETDTYETTWAAIDVGCEACHGPGSSHVAWAEQLEEARPYSENYELTAGTSVMTSGQQVELCASCHSRRQSLGDNTHDIKNLMDYAVPSLLSQDMYYSDGQILDEVYVYGSFLQSKMYEQGVKCSDCHDVHSAELVKEGNALCLQCHEADVYDTKAHHFHKKKGEEGDPIRSAEGAVLFDVGTGAQCVECHMPGRYYMGIDYRRDHSFRVPRPDLTEALGIPNACNQCHVDKTAKWSKENIIKWYGTKYKPHYGSILAAGRKGLPEAQDDLIKLVGDPLYSPIVRATALSLLQNYDGEEVVNTFQNALVDENPILRHTALRHADPLTVDGNIQLIVPLLDDPIKAVRIEAANALSTVPTGKLQPEQLEKLKSVLKEYEEAMLYTADFASSRHNLGNMYVNYGKPKEAEKHYQKAMQIDRDFYPSKVNLAMLYNSAGRNDEAEALFREIIAAHPDLFEIQYSLGLLLVEQRKYQEAAEFLERAAEGLPQRPRIQYNLGLLLAQMQEEERAESHLLKAVEIEPNNRDYLYAITDFYLKRGRLKEARAYAQRLVLEHPSWDTGHEILNFLEKGENEK